MDPKPVSTPSLAVFTEFKSVYSKIKTSASEWSRQVTENRNVRRAAVNVKTLQNEGVIGANETYISVPIIDQHIKRGAPARLAYLKSAARLAIFEQVVPNTQNSGSLDLLANEFSRVMMYQGWELDYMRWMDSSELHGIGALEVMYDPTKSGCVCVSFIPIEDLEFNRAMTSMQDSKVIVRVFKVDQEKFLDMAARYKFKPQHVTTLLEKFKNEPEGLKIKRVMYKEGGKVWVGWSQDSIDDWVRNPAPFFNGVIDKVTSTVLVTNGMGMTTKTEEVKPDEVIYPYFLLFKDIMEDNRIDAQLGRAATDYYMQDSISALVTSNVNQNMAATTMMAAPDGGVPEDTQAAPRQTELVLKKYAIWSRGMKFFNPPAPDPEQLAGLQNLMVLDQQLSGQISAATNNRKDSRKTAAEVNAATNESQMLGNVQVLTLSIGLRPVYDYAWRIIRSVALRGMIKFCVVEKIGVNNNALIEPKYVLKPAGDIDYVEKAQNIANLQQDVEKLAATPIGAFLLRKYMGMRYPSMKAELDAFMDQMAPNNPVAQLLQQTAGILHLTVTDETGQVKPEFKPMEKQFQALAAKIQQVLSYSGQVPQQAQG